ncbi:hypothetical protein ML090_005148 [Klebsiella pneumoniae]|nr:hypothetical protein [Klebsiella pneumoniae]
MEFNTKSQINDDLSGSTGSRKEGIVYNNEPLPDVQQSPNDRPYSDKIGKGEDAKSSVVWFVITFTLTLYGCIIAAMIIVDILNNKGVNILSNLKESWAVFTPIITLSLGYMFGKQSETKKDGETQDN